MLKYILPTGQHLPSLPCVTDSDRLAADGVTNGDFSLFPFSEDDDGNDCMVVSGTASSIESWPGALL